MGDVRGHRLERVVDKIYGAVGEPDAWADVLQEVAEAVGARGALLFRPSTGADPLGFWSPAADDLVDWALGDGKHLHNPRPARAQRRGLGHAVTESDLFSQTELERDPFNIEMIGRLGYRWEAGGTIGEIDGAPLLFTAQRRADQERFDRSELDSLEAVFPHLARAAQFSVRLAMARAEGALYAFDQMACGGVLLGSRGRVLKVNASAARMMGRGIDVAADRVVVTDAAANTALQAMVETALASDLLKRERVRPTVVIDRRERGPLIAYAIPLRGGIRDLFTPGRALLVLEEPEARRQVSGAALASSFGLTPAEVRLATALAEGKDLKAAAEERGVTIGTVRSQLKSLMAKTDTRRQAELVGLLLRYSVNGHG